MNVWSRIHKAKDKFSFDLLTDICLQIQLDYTNCLRDAVLGNLF